MMIIQTWARRSAHVKGDCHGGQLREAVTNFGRFCNSKINRICISTLPLCKNV